MDTTKQNQASDGQDSSDDLIAELARLVAKDARTTSSNSAAYQRVEPSFAPETEQAPQYSAEVGAPEDARQEPAPEPSHDESEMRAQDETVETFDFDHASEPDYREAHGGESTEQAGDDYDPIAELIANAEQDEMVADNEADRADAQDDDLFFATPTEPGDAAIFRDEPPAAEPDPKDEFLYDDERWTPTSYSAPRAEPLAYDTRDDRDPLSEIEALIGEAARVSATDEGGASGRRVKSSFLDDDQPQAPVYPRDERNEGVDAAEAAIMAAAAATGAQARHVQATDPGDMEGAGAQSIPDPLFAAPRAESQARAPEATDPVEPESEEFAFEDDYVEPVRRRRRPGFLVPAAAGAVLFALIGGTYFMFFAGPGDPGEAPVLSADAGAFKEDAPEVASTDAASQSVVFNELGGNASGEDGETLVSRDQTGGVTGDEVSGVIGSEEGEMALANRPVRTVTVRPDGTIVNAEDSVAGSNVLPVERPDVPTVPNSVTASDPIGEAIMMAMGDGVAPAAEPTADTAPGEAVASTDASANASNVGDPTPIARPANLTEAQTPVTTADATAGGATAPEAVDVAAVTPSEQATPATTETAAVSNADVGAWVQLSSQRSEEVARAGIPTLQSQYGALFNGATLDVSRVDLGERGIYYRVRLPQPTFEAATSVCDAIRAQSGDCFVLNN